MRTARQWGSLCRLLGLDEAERAQEQWARTGGRGLVTEAHAGAVERWMKTNGATQAMEALQAAGIPAGRVHDARDALDDPQLRHRGHWRRLEHAEMGRTVYDAPVARLSRTPARLSRPAPLLGEHTDEVLQEVLGMSRSECEHLRAQGVLG